MNKPDSEIITYSEFLKRMKESEISDLILEEAKLNQNLRFAMIEKELRDLKSSGLLHKKLGSLPEIYKSYYLETKYTLFYIILMSFLALIVSLSLLILGIFFFIGGVGEQNSLGKVILFTLSIIVIGLTFAIKHSLVQTIRQALKKSRFVFYKDKSVEELMRGL